MIVKFDKETSSSYLTTLEGGSDEVSQYLEDLRDLYGDDKVLVEEENFDSEIDLLKLTLRIFD